MLGTIDEQIVLIILEFEMIRGSQYLQNPDIGIKGCRTEKVRALEAGTCRVLRTPIKKELQDPMGIVGYRRGKGSLLRFGSSSDVGVIL